MRVEPVELSIETGRSVRGQRWPGGPEWAILLHDIGGDLDAWRDLPSLLAQRGYTVLALDLPGHGLSDDPWDASHGRRSVTAGLDYARTHGAQRLFLITAGVMTGISLAATAGSAIDALVALSPIRLGLDDRSDEPAVAKLIMAGAKDSAALTEAQQVFRRSNGWAMLSTFAVREQGTGLLASDWGAQVREQIARFLDDYRLPSP